MKNAPNKAKNIAKPIYLANHTPKTSEAWFERLNVLPNWTPKFLITTYATLAIPTSDLSKTSLQLVKKPTVNIAKEYPIAIIAAEILIPIGKFLFAFSVWSTSPPTASNPPYAKIAKTKNPNIPSIDLYSGLGDWKNAWNVIGCATLNLFPINTINDPTIKTTFALVTKKPPTEATLEIPFKPLDDKKVITIIKIIPNTAYVWAGFNPKIDQVDVLSLPTIKFDNGTHFDDETLTIHIKKDENHINVPINANLVPTALSIHEYIPPFSSLNAAPNSAIINEYGKKKAKAPNKYQGIAEYPIK